MARDEEMTRAQAHKIMVDLISTEGHEMEPTPEAKARGIGRHDVPTKADLDALFPWEREGKPRPPHPDD